MEIKFLRYESIQSLKWLLTLSLLFSGKNRDNLLWNSRFSVSFCFSGSRTCCDIKHSYPRTPSGSYVIDPDGEGGEKPFKDFCDTADEDSVGVTVVSHVMERRWSTGYEWILSTTNVHAAWTIHVQTLSTNVTATNLTNNGERTVVYLLTSPGFPWSNWGLDK